MSVNVVLRLTRSQQMALVDILVAYMRSDDVQEFVDVCADVTTTPGDLLRICGDVREMEVEKSEQLQKLVEIYRPCKECGHSRAAHCNLLNEGQWTCSMCLCGFYDPDVSCEQEVQHEAATT
jgi:hypothetical protein